MKEFHEVDSGVALCCMTKCDTVDAGKQGAQVRGYTAKHWTRLCWGATDQLKSACNQWCIKNNFEFIETWGLEPKRGQCPIHGTIYHKCRHLRFPHRTLAGSEGREKANFARVLEALNTHMWSNMQMNATPSSAQPPGAGLLGTPEEGGGESKAAAEESSDSQPAETRASSPDTAPQEKGGEAGVDSDSLPTDTNDTAAQQTSELNPDSALKALLPMTADAGDGEGEGDELESLFEQVRGIEINKGKKTFI